MPFVAGASTDSGARVIAQVLEARWGVPVKVVNKPGGNTVPAVTEVMAAKPDGTTMLVDNIASSAMLDTVVKNLPFKVTDRTFVAVTAYTPMMFIVHPNSPFKTLTRGGRCHEEGHRDLHLDVARGRRRAGHGVSPLRRRGRRRRQQRRGRSRSRAAPRP